MRKVYSFQADLVSQIGDLVVFINHYRDKSTITFYSLDFKYRSSLVIDCCVYGTTHRYRNFTIVETGRRKIVVIGRETAARFAQVRQYHVIPGTDLILMKIARTYRIYNVATSGSAELEYENYLMLYRREYKLKEVPCGYLLQAFDASRSLVNCRFVSVSPNFSYDRWILAVPGRTVELNARFADTRVYRGRLFMAPDFIVIKKKKYRDGDTYSVFNFYSYPGHDGDPVLTARLLCGEERRRYKQILARFRAQHPENYRLAMNLVAACLVKKPTPPATDTPPPL